MSKGALAGAWTESRDSSSKPGKPGLDGERAVDFERHLDKNLEKLAEAIASGTHHFAPLRAALLLKKGGGYRIICVPTIRDRLVQRAIGLRLTKTDRLGVISPVSYGFIKGRSVRDAVEEAARLRRENRWVFKADISKFFDSIPREELKADIRSRLRDSSLVPFLSEVIDREIRERDPRVRAIIAENGIRPGVGLRQGMPLSPLLSNFVLKRFDRMVIRRRIPAIRYADDLIFFAPSKTAAREHGDFAREELRKLGFELPALGVGSKVQICAPEDGVEFLGLDLRWSLKHESYTAHIPASSIARICSDIEERANVAKLIGSGKTIFSFNEHLLARLKSYHNAYGLAENKQEFVDAITASMRDALRSVLAQMFSANAMRQLSPTQLAFLGCSVPRLDDIADYDLE